MSKKVNHRFEPELRFPEFKGTPQWEKLPIGKKVELLSGYPFKSQDMTDDLDGTPLLRGINITEGHIRHSKDIDRYIVGDVSAFKKYLLKKDDLVIGMDGSKVGKNSALVSTDDAGSLLIQRVARLRSGCNSTIQFIYQHVHSSIFHSYVDRINTSGGIPHISAKQINDFEICFPEDTREQQNIADCLSSLDELIATHTQKHKELQSYKKGLLQNLFPAEGQTVPALRFPEFANSGDWEETRLSKLGDLVSGLTYRPDDVRDSGLLVLRSSNVQDGIISLEDNVYVDPDIKGANLTQPNDILICVRNGPKALIGKNALIPEGVPLSTHGAFMTVFRSKSAKFVFQLFQTEAYKRQVNADLGATINSINGNQLKKYSFVAPKPEEQERVADFLFSVDELIAGQAQKIAELKAHKKGLMQQLFPSVDEVGA